MKFVDSTLKTIAATDLEIQKDLESQQEHSISELLKDAYEEKEKENQ